MEESGTGTLTWHNVNVFSWGEHATLSSLLKAERMVCSWMWNVNEVDGFDWGEVGEREKRDSEREDCQSVKEYVAHKNLPLPPFIIQ